MSGGSWEYVYHKFQEIGDALLESKCCHRRVLGAKILVMAHAMKAIEWVDSGDFSAGADIEPIKKALGGEAEALVLQEQIKEAERVMKELGDLLKKCKGKK